MKVKQIHQIEVTSRCNLRCKYCVHSKMLRAKEDMQVDTYLEAIAKAKYLKKKYNTMKELNLCGIGESSMHPNIQYFISYARFVFPDIFIFFATNGVTFTEEIAKCLADNNAFVFVSMHRPEKASYAVNIARKYNVLKGVDAAPVIASVNWAGQVDYPQTAEKTKCIWVPEGRAMVTAQGDLVTCCYDGNNTSKFSTVFDDPDTWNTQPYDLCKTCLYEV